MITDPIIITARAGSKRLPGKNLKLLCGKPMISYAIIESKKVSNSVYVSSDSDEILEIAEQYGAIRIKRPSLLAKDDTPSEETIKHCLSNIGHEGSFILVQPTSPLVKSHHIEGCWKTYKLGVYDAMASIEEQKWSEYDIYGSKQIIVKQARRLNGAIFITHSDKIYSSKKVLNGHVGYYTMPAKYSIDINTLEDFELCELIMLGEKNKCSCI
jgi:CMP-N-acetylneuraminic acid synthetase